MLIAVALLAGSLAAGIQLGGLTKRARPTAPGLHAEALPPDMVGTRAPDFRLVDGRGGLIDTRKLRGRAYAVTFLYTQCLDVCPAIADDLRDAIRAAPGAKVVAVSVDPRGDTAAAVRTFAARHRLPPSFRYAIGSRQELEPVWRAYLASPQRGDPGESSHSVAVWLVDGARRLRGLYPGAPVPPADVAHDLLALQRGQPASSSTTTGKAPATSRATLASPRTWRSGPARPTYSTRTTTASTSRGA